MRHYKIFLNFRLRVRNFSTFFALTLSLTLLTFLESIASETQSSTSEQYTIVKKALFDQPYTQRPNYIVNRRLFGKSNNTQNNRLLNAAKRTLSDSRDLIEFPSKQKLLQANGICFAGLWSIDNNTDKTQTKAEDNNFTGLFSPGTFQSVIVRASVALSGTTQKDKRAFGMAIKFFPKDLKETTSLNAFLLNSFGGVVSKHILDLPMDNEPTLGSLPKFKDLGTALRLKKDLEKADRAHGAQKARFSFRPITHLATYQNTNNSLSHISPKWLRLTAKTPEPLDTNDFRDELNTSAYPNKRIIYSINVAENASKKSQARWKTIGQLILNESITSSACDQRLHFQHPRLG